VVRHIQPELPARFGVYLSSAFSLFSKSALEAIRNVPGKGRPPKAKPEAPAAKKPRK
jgi:hypothetical protein